MTTKELIKLLQEVDPEGDTDVCVGNCSVVDINKLPSYYDGPLQVVITDEAGYSISGKYKRNGHKVDLYTSSFSQLVWDRKNFPVDYSELGEERAKIYKENHDKIRQEAKNLDYKLDLEYFTKHIKKRAADIMEDDENALEGICKTFFDEHYKERTIPSFVPIKKEGDSWYLSYVDRKNLQWSMEVEIIYGGYGFELKKIPPVVVENN